MSGVKLNGCGMVTLSCFIREEVQMVKVVLVLGDALMLGTKSSFSLHSCCAAHYIAQQNED